MRVSTLMFRATLLLLLWPLLIFGCVTMLCAAAVQVGWYATDEWLKEHL